MIKIELYDGVTNYLSTGSQTKQELKVKVANSIAEISFEKALKRFLIYSHNHSDCPSYHKVINMICDVNANSDYRDIMDVIDEIYKANYKLLKNKYAEDLLRTRNSMVSFFNSNQKANEIINHVFLTALVSSTYCKKDETYKATLFDKVCNGFTDDDVIEFFNGSITSDYVLINLARDFIIDKAYSIQANKSDHLCFDCKNAYKEKCIKISHVKKDLICNYLDDPGIVSGSQEIKSNLSDKDLIEKLKSGEITSIYDSVNEDNSDKIFVDKFIVTKCKRFCRDYNPSKGRNM